MMSYTSEKTPLLPVVERTLDAYMNKIDQRHREGVEYALLVSTLLLTVFQVVVLYSGDSLVPIALDGQYYALPVCPQQPYFSLSRPIWRKRSVS